MKYLLKYILQNIILLKCYLFLNSTIEYSTVLLNTEYE